MVRLAPATTRSYDADGRLVKLEHGRSVLEYRYDLTGQLLSESSRLGSQPALTAGYRYDLGGRRSGLTTPGGGHHRGQSWFIDISLRAGRNLRPAKAWLVSIFRG